MFPRLLSPLDLHLSSPELPGWYNCRKHCQHFTFSIEVAGGG